MTRWFQFSLRAVLVAVAVTSLTAFAVVFWLAVDRNAKKGIDRIVQPVIVQPVQEGDKIIPLGKQPKSIFNELEGVPLADDDEGEEHAMTSEKWPFADLPNVAVITVRQILEDGEPILYVTHDADDGGWQFLTGGDVSPDDAMVVSLEEILKHDPTLADLADLDLGWSATRQRVGAPWHRTKS